MARAKACPVCGKREPDVHFDARQRMCRQCNKENAILRLADVALSDMRKTNEVREAMKRPLLVVKVRECLQCDRRFESTGDRICPLCQEKNSQYY